MLCWFHCIQGRYTWTFIIKFLLIILWNMPVGSASKHPQMCHSGLSSCPRFLRENVSRSFCRDSVCKIVLIVPQKPSNNFFAFIIAFASSTNVQFILSATPFFCGGWAVSCLYCLQRLSNTSGVKSPPLSHLSILIFDPLSISASSLNSLSASRVKSIRLLP